MPPPDPMSDRYAYPLLSPYQTGLANRCPRCGQGRLYDGFLSIAKQCQACSLNYSNFDPADGPAIFIMMIVGFIVTAGALIVEVAYQPAYWIHGVLWVPLAVGLCLVMLRPFKSVLIALQYKHRAAEGRLADTPDA